MNIKKIAALLCILLLTTGCTRLDRPVSSSPEWIIVTTSQQEMSTSPTEDTHTTESTDTEQTTNASSAATSPQSPEVAVNSEIQALLESMTLHQKICQMFITSPDDLTGVSPVTRAGSTTAAAIQQYPVGGMIYFAQNITSSQQVQDMLRATQQYSYEYCGVGILTAVDEEGGTVTRIAKKLDTISFNAMAYYGADNDADTAYYIGSTIGSYLSELGFNVDFAPVADINIDPDNELGDRIFSDDPEVVANMVTHVTLGLQDSGVSATLKHFPGLGAEDGNTHTNSIVVIDRTLTQLRETELIPFAAAIDAGADIVMVGHQTVTGFGDGLPCDLSYFAVTDILLKELGFDGVAVTDSFSVSGELFLEIGCGKGAFWLAHT